MIRFAVVHRAKDGLALSASTDVDSGVELRDSKRYAKILSRKARQFPVRCTMTVGRFKIYFTTEVGVCFLMICEINLAAVLAFSFVDELKREFTTQYTRGAVDKAIRPYSFIAFDSFIQKTKTKYNNTRTLYTRIDLTDISEELKNNPPYEITEKDLNSSAAGVGGGVIQNSVSNTAKNILKATSNGSATHILPPKFKMDAMTTSNYVAVMVCLLCGVMNIVRLVPFLSQVDMEDETHWLSISFAFFTSAVINFLQCYVLYSPIQRRSIANVGCFLTSLISLYYLFDLRNIYQVLFHFSASLFMAFNVWKRPILGKLPNYNV